MLSDKKKLTSLNNIGVLLKGDLIDLPACCACIRQRARNLSSPGQDPSNWKNCDKIHPSRILLLSKIVYHLKLLTIFAKKKMHFRCITEFWIHLRKWNSAWKKSVFGVFLVFIFPHSDWIRRDTEYIFVFNPNAGKYRPEKLWIRTLYTQ